MAQANDAPIMPTLKRNRVSFPGIHSKETCSHRSCTAITDFAERFRVLGNYFRTALVLLTVETILRRYLRITFKGLGFVLEHHLIAWLHLLSVSVTILVGMCVGAGPAIRFWNDPEPSERDGLTQRLTGLLTRLEAGATISTEERAELTCEIHDVTVDLANLSFSNFKGGTAPIHESLEWAIVERTRAYAETIDTHLVRLGMATDDRGFPISFHLCVEGEILWRTILAHEQRRATLESPPPRTYLYDLSYLQHIMELRKVSMRLFTQHILETRFDMRLRRQLVVRLLQQYLWIEEDIGKVLVEDPSEYLYSQDDDDETALDTIDGPGLEESLYLSSLDEEVIEARQIELKYHEMLDLLAVTVRRLPDEIPVVDDNGPEAQKAHDEDVKEDILKNGVCKKCRCERRELKAQLEKDGLYPMSQMATIAIYLGA
ncbi:hypothetical protein PVAG01_10649 [Phlyctema vagabunda]|uniref:Uncharacterized protein n=1 Tax=Phlyctema vagabunda TaxID=108571 RepID=A0ABR4P2V3_9HELO